MESILKYIIIKKTGSHNDGLFQAFLGSWHHLQWTSLQLGVEIGVGA